MSFGSLVSCLCPIERAVTILLRHISHVLEFQVGFRPSCALHVFLSLFVSFAFELPVSIERAIVYLFCCQMFCTCVFDRYVSLLILAVLSLVLFAKP